MDVNKINNIDDIFPFKFEFFEAIEAYLKNNKSTLGTYTPLMAIYLMYLHDDLKDHIKELAIKHNITEYIMDPPEGIIEYSRSLPNTLYTLQMYDEEEYFIAKNVGFDDLETYEYKQIHDFLHVYIHNTFPKYAVN